MGLQRLLVRDRHGEDAEPLGAVEHGQPDADLRVVPLDGLGEDLHALEGTPGQRRVHVERLDVHLRMRVAVADERHEQPLLEVREVDHRLGDAELGGVPGDEVRQVEVRRQVRVAQRAGDCSLVRRHPFTRLHVAHPTAAPA